MTEPAALEITHPEFWAGDLFRIHAAEGRVVRLDVVTGVRHRGIEKLAETKSWSRLIPLLERICGICSASHPAALVRAVEELAEVRPPERAQYIRTLSCELERLQSHLLWFATLGHLAGFETLWMWTWRYREELLVLNERISGNRLIPSLIVPGGVRRDLDGDMKAHARRALEKFRPALDLLDSQLSTDPVLRSRMRGIGVLDEETARKNGAVGPMARASGVALDVRKDDPYFAYPWVDWNLSLRADGDVQSRAEVRLEEMRESLDICVQCLERMRPGPVLAELPRVPAGMAVSRVEAPRGELFNCVVSDGSAAPVRLQIRPPSAPNLKAIEAVCPGTDLEDIAIVLASADPCTGCAERVTVIDASGAAGPDPVRLSRVKTARSRTA
ncbi:MAG: nickel-dependent hydrogenase large subunit [bacterium]|nr:nickel-dependent hydrogenase large subunit [bacterium]